jgi:hypothetical protein
MLSLIVPSAIAHRSSGWLNEAAFWNMPFMYLTLRTSHLSNGVELRSAEEHAAHVLDAASKLRRLLERRSTVTHV